MTALESLREQLNASAGSGPGGAERTCPSSCAGLIRALARIPSAMRASMRRRQLLLQYRAVHVGIAVQTPQGLKVPVIRDAQKLSLQEIDAEIRRLSSARRVRVGRGRRNSPAPPSP